MLKSLLAVSALSLPAAALIAQAPQARVEAAQWTLAGGSQGCAVHSSSPQGTVVSILAGAGQDDLLFLVQNPEWALDDGRRYEIAVAFDGSEPWELQAVAKTEIDADGPGLMFVVPEGDRQGLDFIAQFAGARGMQIRSDGTRLASLPLGSGRSAMTALAGCLGKMMGGAEASNAGYTFEGGGPAIKI